MTNNKRTALFAGSFNPITLGHLDVLEEGAKMFDEVIIAIADNPNKGVNVGVNLGVNLGVKNFSTEEKIEMIKLCTKHLPNVRVDSYKGLTVEYAKKNNAEFLLRGIRSVKDFEYEKELAQNNRALAPDIKTIFLITKPEHEYISSGAVREILNNNGDISKFVPKEIIEYIKNR